MMGASMRRKPARAALLGCGSIVCVVLAGCAAPAPTGRPPRPRVAPDSPIARAETLRLDASQVRPMYTELVPIDLATIARVALASNADVLQARQAVEASQGRLESTIGSAFPAIVPTALFEHVEGTVRATPGDLVGVGFDSFQVSGLLHWVINPGRVVYEIVAARKRLAATQQSQEAAVQATLRRAALQYYELALTQAQVAAAREAIAEAEELLRVSKLRVENGVGVPADEMRAAARVAERRQTLIRSMTGFYDASIALGLTLQLDPKVTLIPDAGEMSPFTLVRGDLTIDDLLAAAVEFRPDLAEVRTMLQAAVADGSAARWGHFGPQFQAGYQYGGIMGHSNNTDTAEGIPGNLIVSPASPNGSFSSSPLANGAIKEGILRGSRHAEGSHDETFGMHDQQRAFAGVGWRLSLSAFGELKTVGTMQEQARIESERVLAEVQAQVVSAHQSCRAGEDLIELSWQEVESAGEALRLTEANLRAGTMTTLDVLQAQDAGAQARLRFAEAVIRFNQAQVDLLAALGLLDERSLIPGEDPETP